MGAGDPVGSVNDLMTLDFHVLWMLTGVGTVVFATLAAPSPLGHAGTALSFAAATIGSAWFGTPSPEVIGLLVAGAAVASLLRPRATVVAPLLAGGLAGCFGVMFAAQGLPLGAAAALAAVGPIAAARAARQPSFAPPRLRDEALLVLTVLGTATALVPGVQEGWRAAVNLSVQSPAATAMPLPAWTLGVGASALALGALYSVWSRR